MTTSELRVALTGEGDARTLEVARAVIERLGLQVERFDAQRPPALLLAPIDQLFAERDTFNQLCAGACRVMLLIPPEDPRRFIQAMAWAGAVHAVSAVHDLLELDLRATVAKAGSKDIFGVAHYVKAPSTPVTDTVLGSNDALRALEKLGESLAQWRCAERLRSEVTSAVEEVLSNAIYNAPVSASHESRYASRDRREPVMLDASEVVTLEYAFDGRWFGFSVRDRFGRLAEDTVRQYVSKGLLRGVDQIDRKVGGAGLGLYSAFAGLNHLVVNGEPGVSSEVIGLSQISGSYRRAKEAGKGLSMFRVS